MHRRSAQGVDTDPLPEWASITKSCQDPIPRDKIDSTARVQKKLRTSELWFEKIHLSNQLLAKFLVMNCEWVQVRHYHLTSSKHLAILLHKGTAAWNRGEKYIMQRKISTVSNVKQEHLYTECCPTWVESAHCGVSGTDSHCSSAS